MRTQSPPLQHKRPRGLWRGRRGAAGPTCAEPKLGTRSHDPYSDPADSSASASASSISSDAFEDDFDDDHSSDSSCKRRRLSGALSDSDTLWHQSPSSRALTPDLLYHAPCFPSQILNPPPYPATSPYPYIMFPVADKFSSINTKAKGKQSSVTDLEDWENLKELFNRANESYECASLVICSTVHTRLLGNFAPLYTSDLGAGCVHNEQVDGRRVCHLLFLRLEGHLPSNNAVRPLLLVAFFCRNVRRWLSPDAQQAPVVAHVPTPGDRRCLLTGRSHGCALRNLSIVS